MQQADNTNELMHDMATPGAPLLRHTTPASVCLHVDPVEALGNRGDAHPLFRRTHRWSDSPSKDEPPSMDISFALAGGLTDEEQDETLEEAPASGQQEDMPLLTLPIRLLMSRLQPSCHHRSRQRPRDPSLRAVALGLPRSRLETPRLLRSLSKT